MKDYYLLSLEEFFFAPGACAPAPCGGSPLQGDGDLARCLWRGVGILNEGRKETWNEGTSCF